MAPPLLNTRTGCISCVSQDTKSIYVGGGALTLNANLIIERFSVQIGDWEDSGIVLREEIKKDKTHLVLFNDTEGITLPISSPLPMNDYGD